MDRNEERTSQMQVILTDKTQAVESTAEIALPDYRSEISRLLWVRPTVMPPTRFVSGGKVDFSGPVRYDILYAGPDGRLYSAESEEGYAFSLPTEAAQGTDTESLVTVTPEAVISRVSGPRKLSVRCRMRVRAREYADREMTPRLKGLEGKEPECLCEAKTCKRALALEPVRFEVGDSVALEGGEDEVRLIATDGAVMLSEVVAERHGVRCKGEVLLSMLICRAEEDTLPRVVQHAIPFERVLESEDVALDCAARGMGCVTKVRATVEEGQILAEAEVALWGEAQAEEDVILCRDVFAAGYAAECQQGEERVQAGGCCRNLHFSVAGERPLAELNLAGDVLPVYSVADAEILEKRAEGERTVLAGELHCHTLCVRDGEYATTDFSVPFHTVLDGAWDMLDATAAVPVCRVSLLREALRVDGEVTLCACGVAEETVRTLSGASFCPVAPPKHADVELCYPGAEDTLWAVGKRYGVSPDELAAANGLSSDAPGATDSLAGVRYLLIP